jgi:hypothetical protein
MHKPRSAKSQVAASAAAIGADIHNNSVPGMLDVTIYAPPGKCWSATLGHSISAYYHSDPAAGWQALLDDMADGIEPCSADCPDCE